MLRWLCYNFIIQLLLNSLEPSSLVLSYNPLQSFLAAPSGTMSTSNISNRVDEDFSCPWAFPKRICDEFRCNPEHCNIYGSYYIRADLNYLFIQWVKSLLLLFYQGISRWIQAIKPLKIVYAIPIIVYG